MIRRILALGLLLAALSGCMTNPFRLNSDQWPEIGNEFAKALRWSGPDLAATFFAESSRPAFLAAYGGDAGLQVTNTRHNAVGAPVDAGAQGVLTIEYIRSPSVSVKTMTLPLEWSCLEAGPLLPCRWQITSQLSRLP